jgi:hypothetical protein
MKRKAAAPPQAPRFKPKCGDPRAAATALLGALPAPPPVEPAGVVAEALAPALVPAFITIQPGLVSAPAAPGPVPMAILIGHELVARGGLRPGFE